MTRRGLYSLILLTVAVLFSVYIWPTRYRQIDVGGPAMEMREDRITGRIESRQADGPWTTYAAPLPEYDVRLDSDAGRAIQQTQQAGDEIRKMNEAARKATEH